MSQPYPLTLAHFQIFGGIVQEFARFERLVEVTIGVLLGMQPGLAALVTASLGYNAKCDTLLSLVAVSEMDEALRDGIRSHIQEVNAFAALRNSIAHHVWVTGTRPGSVKPLSVTARGGKGKIKGLKDDEPDYTIDDLSGMGKRMIAARESFFHFLITKGVVQVGGEN
jgi:hypothetical protein